MISSRNLFFCAFANCVCQIIIIISDSFVLLAKEVPYSAGSLNSSNSPSLFLNYIPHKTLFDRDEICFLSIYESIFVFGCVFLILYFFWYFKKPKSHKFTVPGFKLTNFEDQHHFVILKPESQSLEFLDDLELSKKYRLSGNLNRVILTPHKNTFLLEDKNFKNALLINRRRLHRKILFNNDLLDIGEMILLYSNNIFHEKNFQRESHLNYQSVFQSTKPKGPIKKGYPLLNVSGSRQEIPIIRNLNTLGTSKMNDIVIESDEVALRHAKIYKVGQSWKIQNLQNYENTFVNGRRIDQRFLKEGDEVAIGDFIFKFLINKLQIKRQRKIKKENKINSI